MVSRLAKPQWGQVRTDSRMTAVMAGYLPQRVMGSEFGRISAFFRLKKERPPARAREAVRICRPKKKKRERARFPLPVPWRFLAFLLGCPWEASKARLAGEPGPSLTGGLQVTWGAPAGHLQAGQPKRERRELNPHASCPACDVRRGGHKPARPFPLRCEGERRERGRCLRALAYRRAPARKC